jgi:iron complex outermembrane receptor protein
LAGSTLFPTVNSQTATFQGGELQTAFKLTSADTLRLDVNLLNNRFGEYLVNLPYSAPFDLSGTPVPLSPKQAYTLDYEHVFALPNGNTLSLDAGATYATKQVAQGNYNGNLTYTQPAYHKSNLNAIYHTMTGNWTFTGYVRNIENKATINNIAGGYPVAFNFLNTNVMLDAPRTYGLIVRKDF